MDDFGYRKDEKPNRFSDLTKRIFLASATLFSVACFIYITINAYYFVYQDKGGNIEVIKSPEGPIKIIEEDLAQNGGETVKIDHSIYDDIFGTRRGLQESARPKIMTNPQPAMVPKEKEMDRRLVKEGEKILEDQKNNKEIEENRGFGEVKKVEDLARKNSANEDLVKKESGRENIAEISASQKKNEKRNIRVQIAAMSSDILAKETWNKLNHLHSDLFLNLKPLVEKVDLGKRGIFYRLQIGNFYNQIEAENFCNKYVVQTQKTRADCIVVE